MRVLIIGASSFLGGHVLREASGWDYEVVTAGRSGVPASASHFRLDLAADGPSRIAGVISSIAPDAVINCAGATAGSPDVLAAANITAVYALVTAMIQSRGPARLVQIGSAAEYGRTKQGVPVAESASPQPASVYGATKLAGTRLVELARTAGLDAVVLRVFNVVGAGAPEDGLPGRAAVLLRQAMARGTDVRLGPLDAVRDFVRRARCRRRGARRGDRAGAAAFDHQHRQRPWRCLPRPGQGTACHQRLRGRGARGRAGLGTLGGLALDAGRHHPGWPGPGVAAVP